MAKTHTSMKFTKLFKNVYYCYYADLQNTFYGYDADYYNAGVYGWNCDLYVDYRTDTVITTGYRNTRGERIPVEIIKKYENKAQEILKSDWFYSNKVKDALEENRNNLFNELAAI